MKTAFFLSAARVLALAPLLLAHSDVHTTSPAGRSHNAPHNATDAAAHQLPNKVEDKTFEDLYDRLVSDSSSVDVNETRMQALYDEIVEHESSYF